MKKPVLYLLIGYPGSGKTSAAKVIAETTGAIHLLADAERHRLFPNPTHSLEESTELYDRLNDETETLLADGKSVVFDTNFNFYGDRQKLRDIAERQGAETVVVWVVTPVEIARERAVGTDMERNGYMMSMTNAQFQAIVSKLEPPRENEKVIKIDGAKLDSQAVAALF
jgi:predicted kinase